MDVMAVEFRRYGGNSSLYSSRRPEPIFGVSYTPGFIRNSAMPCMHYTGTQGDMERVLGDAINCLKEAKTRNVRLILDVSLDGEAPEIKRRFEAYAIETGANIEYILPKRDPESSRQASIQQDTVGPTGKP